MNRSKSINTLTRICCLMTIAAAGTLIWLHQSKPNHVEARTQTDLRLEMSFSQSKYVRHEPIEFRSRLSNQTSERIMMQPPIKFDPRIDFLVQRENGSEIRWKSKDYYGYHHGSIVSGTPALQSGKVSEVRYLIDEEFGTRMFAQPGRYRVRIEFDYEDLSTSERQRQTILSDHILVEIEEPLGRDRLANDYQRNIIDPLRRGGDRNEELRARQYFANQFSDSVYWKYRTFELAERYFDLGRYAEAEDQFFNISDIDFCHSQQVDRRLIELAIKLSRVNTRTRRPRDTRNLSIGVDGPPQPSVTPGPASGNIPPPIPVPYRTPNI